MPGPDPTPTSAAQARATTAQGRLERWKRGLLDLSLRNPLLNHRRGRRAVPLRAPDPHLLEDRLAAGEGFRLVARPRPAEPPGPEDDVLRAEVAAGRLPADLEPEALAEVLTVLDRAARSSLEESGANTLFLALGFLTWFEAPADTEPRRAPLLLVPVRLRRAGASDTFRLEHFEEDALPNVALFQMLRADFGLDVGGLEETVPDDSGVDVAALLERVRALVAPLERWRVTGEAVLGLFSFTKYLMWLDLERHADRLRGNAVVRHLLETPTLPFAPGTVLPEPATLDRERTVAASLCPLEADSSQLAAVCAAADGATFVLEGPPGTGKSQTIANLITQSLAAGKRVLFVSEKMAALDVVFRRLTAVGLAPWCLELHSTKAQRSRLVEQVRQSLEVTDAAAPPGFEAEAERLGVARATLNAYGALLHRRFASGWTPHEALARLTALAGAGRTPLAFGAPDALDAEGVRARREAVADIVRAGAEVGDVATSPWRGARLTGWLPGIQAEVGAAAKELEAASERGAAAARDLADRLGVRKDPLDRADLDALAIVASAAAETRLAGVSGWVPGLLDLDLEALDAVLAHAQGSFWPVSWWRARGARRVLRTVRTEGRLPDLSGLRAVLASARNVRDGARALAAAEQRLFGPDPGGRAALGSRDPAISASLAPLASARESEVRAQRTLCARLLFDPAVGFPPAEDHFDNLRNRAHRLVAGLQALRAWAAFQAALERARGLGLGDLASQVEAGSLAPAEAERTLERSLLEAWVEALLRAEPELARVTGGEQSERVRRFQDLDRALTKAAAAHLVARIAARRPRPGTEPSAKESEMGFAQRLALQKRPRGSIRALLAKMPNVLARLKPCFLMSPLSAAQYLAPDMPPFDLVVFDEASQIPVGDAVGAISRGQALVVVGDSKQLPPTTFFQRLAEGATPEELEDQVEDLDSVLTECSGAGLPKMALAWHYRSRHESLIAFSHRHYYGHLLTFPAADDRGGRLGVSLVPVPDGVYGRGGTRTNRREAEVLVAEAVRRLTDPEERARSVGIVTFSLAQQTLIEDLLDEARRAHPEIEPAFAEDTAEGVFVKNLENVQGDERDVILISVCYGPDAEGRVALGFGPLNADGGERRLNVVVTRAREQVVVFSTLRADQIDLSRTAALGVAHLRAYLEFAARGPAALSRADVPVPAVQASGLEEQVRAALEARGWQVESQVGCSGYRIDLGVRDPAQPGRFLLGVECDGAMYASARTARDRDRLRGQVLANLGWRLFRVWSTDWWSDREAVLARLDEALLMARNVKGPGPAPRPPPPSAVGEEPARLAPSQPRGAPPAAEARSQPYVISRPQGGAGGADALCEGRTAQRVGRAILTVLEEEAPVALDVVVRRVAAAWGVSRVTDRVRARIEILVGGAVRRTTAPSGAAFLWSAEQDPKTWNRFRGPTADGEAPRTAEEIPPQEVAAAARHVLEGSVSLPLDALVRETAKRFGLRAGPAVVSVLEPGVRALVERGGARLEGSQVTLP